MKTAKITLCPTFCGGAEEHTGIIADMLNHHKGLNLVWRFTVTASRNPMDEKSPGYTVYAPNILPKHNGLVRGLLDGYQKGYSWGLRGD